MDDSGIWYQLIYGGDTGLAAFYQFYFDRLYFLGLKYTTDTRLVEDSIQNLFVDLIRYRKKLPQVKYQRGYIFKSFHRLLIREIKKNTRINSENKFSDAVLGFYFIEDPVIFSASDELDYPVKKVLRIIQRLPHKQQEALYLRFTLGLNYKEMSAYLDIEVESVRVIISRAISHIRLIYTHENQRVTGDPAANCN